jgi:glyceraldehyde 3-phosphate dehydrogenase
MIPSTTGAAKAVAEVIPALKGKLHGTAVRVPTPNVSLVDLTVELERPATAEAINAAFKKAADGALKGVLAYSEEPTVSIDYNHHPASSIFDATNTFVVDGTFAKVFAWYDNEWGFSNRMVDVAKLLTK